MGKKTVTSGIIGAGFSASFHFESIKKVCGVNVEVAGVYSVEGSEEFAKARGIKCFETIDELLESVDVVHICSPAQTHEEYTIKALEHNKYPIIEKPLTGYFGDGSADFNGDNFPKSDALDHALKSIERMIEAEKNSQAKILYAENWVYAPSIQKEREVLEKTGAQILWIHGEESHSGSHAAYYGHWKCAGGGVMLSKACHPLTAALYLKRVEGRARDGKFIKPKTVTARVHAITRLENFEDQGHIRSDYTDIDDFSMMHITFEDGTVADIIASDILLGGIHNWLEVATNNHRTICNINPNTSMQTYNAVEENFKDIYVVEKIGTKQGWSCPSPDEDWFTGYPQELEAFYGTVAYGESIESDSSLGADCVSAIYSAYISAENGGAETSIRTF